MITRQHEAILYLQTRIEQMARAGDEENARFRPTIKTDAERQIEAGAWVVAR